MPCPSGVNGLHLCEAAIHKQFGSRLLSRTCSMGSLLTGTPETSRRTSACRSWIALESPRPG